MKKIGLSVCYDTKNFGSQLQVLATVKKIEELGYQTGIIRYKKTMSLRFVLQSLPRVFNSYFIRNKITHMNRRRAIRQHPEIAEKVRIRDRRFRRFVDENFHNLSEPYVGWNQLVKKSAQDFDAFLCGSDQLWLPSNLGSHFYTLEYAPDDKPKIAYATSFGVSQIPWYQKRRTAAYLNRFQSLSTREVAGSRMIRELTQREAPVVCDPTLLFDAAEWDKMIPRRVVIDEPYIFAYFLGTNPVHREAAEELRKQTGLRIVTCPFLDNYVESDRQFGDVQLFDMDSADFVNLIRNAAYVLTDSFHGSVFSILYHKQFITFNRFLEGSNSRNSRIDSLCAILGLGERRYDGDITVIDREIAYERVDERIAGLRESSIDYLKGALDAVE